MGQWVRIPLFGNLNARGKNEVILREGAIRIPLHPSSFLFNDAAFLVIPRKSLQILALLFSILLPTTSK
jgi:hypothetical protein